MGLEGIAVAELGMSRGEGDQLRGQAAWRLQRIGRLEEAERMAESVLEDATSPFILSVGHVSARSRRISANGVLVLCAGSLRI